MCLFIVQAPEAFYEDASQYDDQLTFDDMNLSRPILKVWGDRVSTRLSWFSCRGYLWHHIVLLQAVTALGFKQPTPIQKACVPVGLLGKDLCACAATGTGTVVILHQTVHQTGTRWMNMKYYFLLSSGKTAAFMLPVLERLVYKPRTSQVTRVLVLVPTRELGIQVHSVARQLAQFTSITTCLAVGMSDDWLLIYCDPVYIYSIDSETPRCDHNHITKKTLPCEHHI